MQRLIWSSAGPASTRAAFPGQGLCPCSGSWGPGPATHVLCTPLGLAWGSGIRAPGGRTGRVQPEPSLWGQAGGWGLVGILGEQVGSAGVCPAAFADGVAWPVVFQAGVSGGGARAPWSSTPGAAPAWPSMVGGHFPSLGLSLLTARCQPLCLVSCAVRWAPCFCVEGMRLPTSSNKDCPSASWQDPGCPPQAKRGRSSVH